MAFLIRENRSHGTDGWRDGHTDGRTDGWVQRLMRP